MRRERLALAVPKGVDEDLVVLDGDGADGGAQVKCAALEHDAVLVVDAGALGEDEEGGGVGGLDVLPHALGHHCPVLHLPDDCHKFIITFLLSVFPFSVRCMNNTSCCQREMRFSLGCFKTRENVLEIEKHMNRVATMSPVLSGGGHSARNCC